MDTSTKAGQLTQWADIKVQRITLQLPIQADILIQMQLNVHCKAH